MTMHEKQHSDVSAYLNCPFLCLSLKVLGCVRLNFPSLNLTTYLWLEERK